MSTTPLVDQGYWDNGYADLAPTIAPPEDVLRQWLETNVPRPIGDRHCLEVGCYPGRYLGVLGRMGYITHGIDLTPGVTRMGPAFEAMGIRTGAFTQGDFLRHRFERRYDVVCSFGFIEHFADWRTVLARHAELVVPGGLIMIETPNFRGWVQHLLHRTLDAVNLRRHHVPAMAPARWAELLKEKGFTDIVHGHMGRFEFWADTPPTGRMHRFMLRVVAKMTPVLRRIPAGSAALSPYCVLIARKPEGQA